MSNTQKAAWSFGFVDVDGMAQENQLPVDMVRREDGHWAYLNGPIDIDDIKSDLPWVAVTSGDAVRIPLIPYLSGSDDPEIAIALAFQIGIRSMLNIPHDHVQMIRISIGSPVEQVAIDNQPTSHRFYLGLALKLRK